MTVLALTSQATRSSTLDAMVRIWKRNQRSGIALVNIADSAVYLPTGPVRVICHDLCVDFGAI